MYITTRGAHVHPFPEETPLRKLLCEWHDNYTLQLSSYYTVVFGHTKHVLRALMCAKSANHLWVRGNPQAIHKHDYRFRFIGLGSSGTL